MRRPDGDNRVRAPFHALFLLTICCCCFLAVTSFYCSAAERVSALNYTEKVKKPQTRTPQKKISEVLLYLQGLSDKQLLRLTHEIGGEVFLYQILAERSGKANLTRAADGNRAKMQSRHRLKPEELLQTLQEPEIRERYFDAVANYLLNSTR